MLAHSREKKLYLYLLGTLVALSTFLLLILVRTLIRQRLHHSYIPKLQNVRTNKIICCETYQFDENFIIGFLRREWLQRLQVLIKFNLSFFSLQCK